jgi:sigma-B regulation protein RsbU (phosphoserine phosphatase)
VLGDVSGKGLPAALVAAVLHGSFAIEAMLSRSPAETLARINDALLRKVAEGRFATMFYAVLSRDGRLTCTNAGHNAPILIGPSGVRRLHRGGTIVGALADARFEQETVALESGDCLVAFSDGVTEAFNAEWEEFGDERLMACVQAHAGEPPAVLLARVMASVREFVADAVQSDDLTVLVLRYAGVKA